MKVEDLRKELENRGYTVKNIRVFKKSFHVWYRTEEFKAVRFCYFPLDEIPYPHPRTQRWLNEDFPRIKEEA